MVKLLTEHYEKFHGVSLEQDLVEEDNQDGEEDEIEPNQKAKPRSKPRPTADQVKETPDRSRGQCCPLACTKYVRACLSQSEPDTAVVSSKGGVAALLRHAYYNVKMDLTLVGQGGAEVQCHAMVFALISPMTRSLMDALPATETSLVHVPDLSPVALQKFFLRVYFVNDEPMLSAEDEDIAKVFWYVSHTHSVY